MMMILTTHLLPRMTAQTKFRTRRSIYETSTKRSTKASVCRCQAARTIRIDGTIVSKWQLMELKIPTANRATLKMK